MHGWRNRASPQPQPLPDLRDDNSGEPILLVTDHYRVLDMAALAAALATHNRRWGERQRVAM